MVLTMVSIGREFFPTFISSVVIVLSALTLNENPRRFSNVPVSLNYRNRGLKAMLAYNKNNNNHNLWRAFLMYQAP